MQNVTDHLGSKPHQEGVKVGRDLISRVTDSVMEDAHLATRLLDDVYPVVFLNALVQKIRDGGSAQRKACYLALAITMDGDRDVFGMWFQDTEGAKFWMQPVVVEAGESWLYLRIRTEHRPGRPSSSRGGLRPNLTVRPRTRRENRRPTTSRL